jgi:hypothetical protein
MKAATLIFLALFVCIGCETEQDRINARSIEYRNAATGRAKQRGYDAVELDTAEWHIQTNGVGYRIIHAGWDTLNTPAVAIGYADTYRGATIYRNDWIKFHYNDLQRKKKTTEWHTAK